MNTGNNNNFKETTGIDIMEQNTEKTPEQQEKEKLFKCWDRLGLCKGLQGKPGEDNDITQLYEYR